MKGARAKIGIGLLCIVLGLASAFLATPVPGTLADPVSDAAAIIESTPVKGIVSISGLNGTWVVMRHKTIGNYNCALLTLRNNGYGTGIPFNDAGEGTKYDGSKIQTFLTNNAPGDFGILYSMAVVPALGSHTSYEATSEPTEHMAKAENIKKDVFFLLSRKDALDINGQEAPAKDPFTSANFGSGPSGGQMSMFLRTAVTNSTTEVCEVVIPSGLGLGLHIFATGGGVCHSISVWVRTSETSRTVTVHYVNALNTELSPVTTHKVNNGSDFDLSPVPSLSGYDYLYWKDGASGSQNKGAIHLGNVTQDKHVYLVYAPSATNPERYLVSKDSNPGDILTTWHWLGDAVDACGTDGAYTVTATENDVDMADFSGLYPSKKPIGAHKNIAVTVPSDKSITLTSGAGGPFTITMRSTARHLKVEGSLTLKDIVLDGNAAAGGVDVIKTLIMNDGSVIQNCRGANIPTNTGRGGGMYVAATGKVTMNDGSVIHGNIANNSNNAVGYGGGVYVDGGALTMNGGSAITGNTGNTGANDGAGGGVFVHGGALTMNAGSLIDGNYASSGNVQSGNYTCGGGVYVAAGTNAGSFTMNGGTISNNYAGYTTFGTGGGVYVVGAKDHISTFDMLGGTICDNVSSRTSYGAAGGLRVGNYALVNMSGGSITRNTVSLTNGTGNGGGAYIIGTAAIPSTFNMSGTAVVSENTASVSGPGNGGGVYVDGGTFTMAGNDAAVKNNIASEHNTGNGGGVYLNATAHFSASDTVKITGNKALGGDGGGIYSEGYDYSDPINTGSYAPILKIGNSVVFSGNAAQAAHMPPATSPFISRFLNSLLNNDDINYHHPKFIVIYRANNGTGGIFYHNTGFSSGTHQIAVKALADTGFVPLQYMRFLGWNTQADGKGTSYAPGASLSVSGSLTLYAQWEMATTTLTVTKLVAGDYGDTTRDFTFTVTFEDGSVETFTLKHDGTHTISDLPVGSVITVAEIVPVGYTASYTDSLFPGQPKNGGNTGPLTMTDDPRDIIFTNQRVVGPETGIGLGDTGALLLLPLLALLAGLACLAAKAVRRRRARGVRYQ